MMTWTAHPVGHWVQLPDGDWMLIAPGAFVAFMCVACVLGFACGLLGALFAPPGRQRQRKPKRRDGRGRWS